MPAPFVIEFAGLPAAGKTTGAAALVSVLGSDAMLIDEAATRNPLDSLKDSWPYTAWNLMDTLARLMPPVVQRADRPLIVDRGLVDIRCWLRWFQARGDAEAHAVDQVARLPLWYDTPGLVVYLDVDLDTAIGRGRTYGRIVNPLVFTGLRTAYEDVLRGQDVPASAGLLTVDSRAVTPDELLSIVLASMKALGTSTPAAGTPSSHGESASVADRGRTLRWSIQGTTFATLRRPHQDHGTSLAAAG